MSILSKLTDLPDDHPEVYRDFNKRYENTYMLYTEQGKEPIIVLCRGIDPDRKEIHCYLRDHNIFRVKTDVPEYTLQPFLPKCGYLNIRGIPYYLIKSPQRQWRRSFCNAIYSLQNAYPTQDRMEPQPTKQQWSLAPWAAHIRGFLHLDDIIKPLQGNTALSLSFATHIDEHDTCVLLYKRYKIGYLDFATKTIRLYSKTLAQEVSDLLYRTKVKTWNLTTM